MNREKNTLVIRNQEQQILHILNAEQPWELVCDIFFSSFSSICGCRFSLLEEGTNRKSDINLSVVKVILFGQSKPNFFINLRLFQLDFFLSQFTHEQANIINKIFKNKREREKREM